ncbi:DUF58 domain-containing protein [Actinopolyspora mortivallis]|uniref:DUF58 domain-containing protein n=1 Tax=Actinopolyspora mortivallis TaxID=33906 RepID=A0A2T0GZF2_ACTMO|nr:DUF58 domain-containing protein [Actinopolyspora mortivallis]PRW64413.1 DUF58 domain-containing protein [Actinopolyspora mortivallis]
MSTGVLSALTVRGRCLLAASCAAVVCALVLDERDLLRVAVFAAALPLLALTVSLSARTGLDARRELTPQRVEVGGEASVRLRLTNTGGLPPSDPVVVDEVPHGLGGPVRYRLNGLLPASGGLVEYTVRPRLRGVHRLGPARCRVEDPFGLVALDRHLAGTSRLVAVPEVVPLTGSPSWGEGGRENSGTPRAGHGVDDATLREYRHGDDLRRVHWKTTARRDELMVRVTETPQHGATTVLLDHRSAAHRGTGNRSSLEWAVSAAASICLHLRGRGRRVRLVDVAGNQLGSGEFSGQPDGGWDDDPILESLALLQPTASRELLPDGDPDTDRDLVAILGNTTPAGAEALTSARPESTRGAVILLDTTGWTEPGGEHRDVVSATAHRFRCAGWNVTTVDSPATSVSRAWERLCARDEPFDALGSES